MLTACVSRMQGTFNYGGQTYDLIPSLQGASRAACERLVTLVLKQNEPCGAEQVSKTCLNGVAGDACEKFLRSTRCGAKVLAEDRSLDYR